ncbi:MAG: 16S rRNA (adenine(1518)-N(6)/adenine(1519)-N(6))-dimethyltransferase RsmA [Acidilobus sp.]
MTLRAHRRLGQHFLVDNRGVDLFLELLGAFEGRDFLEVGPGLGALTIDASRIARRLVAVEIDPLLAERLSRRLPPNASVVVGDGVSFVLATTLDVVFSNSPFYLTGRLVAAAARNNNIRTVVIGCQKEVADRLVAKPGDHDYGRLSVMAQAFFDVSLKGHIPAEWFRPRPNVDAALVMMKRRRPWGPDGEVLEKVTRCLFTQRNRVAGKVARYCLPGIPIKGWGERRVRELTPDQLLEVSSWLAGVAGGK